MAVEITSREELQAWLEDKPREWAQVIALRGALRVLPMVADPENREVTSKRPELTFSSLRALAVSSVAAKVPTDDTVRAAAAAAARAAAYNPAYAAAAAARAAAYYPASAAAAAAAARAAAWEQVSADCTDLESMTPEALLSKPLWNTRPDWFQHTWGRASQWLSRPEDNFEIWREWYYGRLEGLPHAFADFDDEADEAFYRWIIEQTDDWWKREPREVNADIRDFVDGLRRPKTSPPTDEELEQNPRAFTFSLNSEGCSELDEELLPNGLQGDADERDNHGEILRLIDLALVATDGDTNAKAIAEPTQLLREAVGETVDTLRPRLFVLRSREVIRWVEDSKGEDLRIPGLSKAQNDAFTPLVAALEMIAEFSPKLAELWHGKMGQTGAPLTREMLDLIAQALRTSGQTTELAQSIIEASNRQVAPDAAEDDPARIAASETSRNIYRKMGGALKKTGDGARAIDSIGKVADRALKMWGSLKGRLPSGDIIERVLQMFGGS